MGHEDGTNSIEEGRLVAQPCACCGKPQWRAFGEFESARGELTSYAFGWVPGHDEKLADMTIGMGVGNEGGGSFHIKVGFGDESTGMRLVDEPFEDVPEGGPDLTREEALAHDALPYIWMVSDEVMAQDRRAWWMTHWLQGTRVFATKAVAEDEEPVVRIRRADGDWELYSVNGDEPVVLHLFHALDADQSLLEVLDLEEGESADRAGPGTPWVRSSD